MVVSSDRAAAAAGAPSGCARTAAAQPAGSAPPIEPIRLGTSDALHRMCPRCRLEYRSPDLLGVLDGMWMELWQRTRRKTLHGQGSSTPDHSCESGGRRRAG
jgi:hypothetical protein